MALTAKQVASSKPGRLSDGGGLYLLTKDSGSRSWVLRVQRNGVRKDYGLGGFTATTPEGSEVIPLEQRPTLTLAEAREKARRGRELAKAGFNPSEVWRSTEKTVPTFEAAARQHHEKLAAGWRNGKHVTQWISTLEAYAFPIIGKQLVSEIDASAMEEVLRPIWRSKPETARRIRQRMGKVLNASHALGHRDSEAPMAALKELMDGIKQPKGQNFAAMPWEDAPAFYQRVAAADYSAGVRALQFVMLVVPRSGECRKARMGQIDFKKREWAVPPLNTKTDKPHLVPLSPAAFAIALEAREYWGDDPDQLLFPGMNGEMSDATIMKALKVHGGGEYTVHGFRSTFRDWAAERGFNDSWAEAALAHSNPDTVEAAYRRTVFFNQRRDKLMPAWEGYLRGRKK